MAGVEQRLQRLAVALGALASAGSAPRPSRAPASAARRGSARRSPASSARGRCPRSAARASPPRGARQQPVEQRRAGAADVQGARGRWSEAQTHRVRDMLFATTARPRRARARTRDHRDGARHADRSARLPRRRPAQGGRARRGARLPRDPDLQPVAAACGGRPPTARRTSRRSARRWPPARSTRC